MSLNWNVKKIKDSDELFIPGEDTEGSWKPVKPGTEKEGNRYLNPITDALIWACMAIEIGEIKESNTEEFWLRLSVWQTALGPMLQFKWEGENKGLTYNDVKRHIGLYTNVATKPRAYFMKKVSEVLIRNAGSKPDSVAKSLFDQYKERLAEKFEEASHE